MAAIYSNISVDSHNIQTQQQQQQRQQSMSDRKQLLCRFHLRGSCRDGDWCNFSHNTDQSVPIPETVCWYYLHSHCMYGDNCRFIHLDATAILANNLSPAAAPDVTEQSSAASIVSTVLPSSAVAAPPTVAANQPIPQTIVTELSPAQQSLQQLSAHNSYNNNRNQMNTEVNPLNSCHKLLGNPSVRPQLVPFNNTTNNTNMSTTSSSSSPPTQSSNPSLIDSRQSSEDSGYSELNSNNKQTSQLSQTSGQSNTSKGGGGLTYAQMASNKDCPKNVSNVVSVRTNITPVQCYGSGGGLIGGGGGGSSANISRSKTMCPYSQSSIDGICPYPEGMCHYTHGQVCDLCGRGCLDPNDVDQQNKHRDECIREHEREMEISFAIQRSLDKACGICMDIVIEKEPITERRFGILEKCSHIFCLSCIRKWRQTKQFDNRTIRACPECRVSSDFVIPSKYWYDERSEKQQLIDSYKRALSTKPCKYFKQGQGECPFAGACFYLHAYPDGRKAEMPPPRQRRRQNHEGELETLRDMLLWNYLEVRDDNHWLLTLDLEDVFDIQEMGLLSGYETDDESDLSDYAENLLT